MEKGGRVEGRGGGGGGGVEVKKRDRATDTEKDGRRILERELV